MTGGDKGHFGEKLNSIIENLTAEQREHDYQGSSVNLEIIKPQPKKEGEKQDKYIRGTVRQLRSVAPSVRERGKMNTTPVNLKDNEGIDEKTHFIYCPETSLVCIEYNYHGPKIGLLTYLVNSLYKENIAPKAKRSGYEYIKAQEAVSKVEKTTEVRSVVAQMVDPQTTGNLNSDLDLPAVFKAFKPPKHTKLEFVIKPQKQGAAAMLTADFKKWFLRKKSDLEYFDKLQVKITDDETGKPAVYDLVKDKLQDEVIAQFTPGTSEINTPQMMKLMEEHITKAKAEYILK